MESGEIDAIPVREDAQQGALGDAGLVAVLGAVAGHLPGEIARRVAEQADGSYLVTLSEACRTLTGAVPGGRLIELRVSPDLPVYDHSPGEPAYAKADRAAWAAIAEKAFAGVDAVWTARRWNQWQETWARTCAADAADPEGTVPRRNPAPSGYVRLGQGSSALDHAEALTHLTGRHAAVREFPRRRGKIRRALRRQLREAKPVIAATCAGGSQGPLGSYRLVGSHCYEIVAVGWRTAVLRNPWGFYHPGPVPLARLADVLEPVYATLA